MSNKNDGGPALPIDRQTAHGMSLRDYFAAKALDRVGKFPDTMILNPKDTMNAKQAQFFHDYCKANVQLAYVFADYMMAQRDEK